MIGLVLVSPGGNSYTISLLNAYKEAGVTIICEKHNFFVSNFIPDFVHIHWPELIIDWIPFVEKEENMKLEIIRDRLNWYKKNKTLIIFTVHNLEPHNDRYKEFYKNLYNLIFEYVDIYIHHCSNSICLFKKKYRNIQKMHIIACHGDYLTDFNKIEKNEARKYLGINSDKFVILNFGQQRKYKGLEFLNKVFNNLLIKNKYLLNAGNFSYSNLSIFQKYFWKIINYYRTRIKFSSKKYLLRTIKQNEIAPIFSASDIIFLGHQSGLNSGVLAMAATFSVPVVFPDIGCFKEQMKYWLFETYEVGNINSAQNAINNIFKKIKNKQFRLDNSQWLKENSWKNHVDIIITSINSFKG